MTSKLPKPSPFTLTRYLTLIQSPPFPHHFFWQVEPSPVRLCPSLRNVTHNAS